ncbi:MAG: 50S ribosomal protein L25/general stress protein Ctc [Bacteroidota bacterium]
MKTVEIIGFKRANLGKSEVKKLRSQGNVPCVIYGGDEQIHFYVPMILFRELLYTSEAHFVNLDIEGEEKWCIIQDAQFHPVSEIILHADFLELHEGRPVKMDIPISLEGQAKGVLDGGTLMHKRRSLSVKAKPKNMPEKIVVDVTDLDFNSAIKVSDIEEKDFTILDPKQASIAVIEIPRALRGKTDEDEELEEGAEAAAEGAEA